MVGQVCASEDLIGGVSVRRGSKWQLVDRARRTTRVHPRTGQTLEAVAVWFSDGSMVVTEPFAEWEVKP